MAITGPTIVALVMLVLVGVVPIVLVARRRRRANRVAAADHPGLRRLQFTAIRARAGGLLVGIVLAWILAAALPLGIGVLLASGVIGLGLVVSIIAEQRMGRTAAATTGSASLEVRRMRDYVPGFAKVLLPVLGLAVVMLLAWTMASASPDDLGRAGRAYASECVKVWHEREGSDWVAKVQVFTFGGSPFPGAFYAPWIGAVLALVLVCAVVALRAIAARPRNGSDIKMVSVDDSLRRQAGEGVAAAVGFALAGTFAGSSSSVLLALRTPAECNYGTQGLGSFLLGLAMIGAGLTALWCIAVLLTPVADRK